ncbi:MAG: putative 3-methyladenine glycosylase [Gammaproteobacteria bacterium]|jgi:DNA-3-methyladenine glycosylase|nr:putative 3-methyladenine glycosylase [Gammaproteobacteria bacterium]
MLSAHFFDRDPQVVAKDLLGKVIRVKYKDIWLSASIIETEAYYIHDKGSHASLGFTQKRKALFMPAGTIYMYYARGGDSLNISCHGEGNAVLIKSGRPYIDQNTPDNMIEIMQKLNPLPGDRLRDPCKLCSGQTLLCKSLGLKVPQWDTKTFDPDRFYFEDVGYRPKSIIQTKRLGIPLGRDEHLMYRFIDHDEALHCTLPPYGKKGFKKSLEYTLHSL